MALLPPPRTQRRTPGAWRTQQEPYNGGTYTLRYNAWSIQMRAHPRLSTFINIELRYDQQSTYPARPPEPRLAAFEKHARQLLCRSGESILVAVGDMPDYRTWFFYSELHNDRARPAVTQLRQTYGDLSFTVGTQSDPKWKLHKKLMR